MKIAIVPYIAILLTAVLTAWLWNKLPPLVPWLYSLPWGPEQLISKLFFALGLLGLTLVHTINLFVAKKTKTLSPAVEKTVLAASLLATIIYLLGYWKVLTLMV